MCEVKKVSEGLMKLPKGGIVLLETKPEKSLEVNWTAVKKLEEMGNFGIIVSASRPYQNIISVYKNNMIALNKIFIIDLVSQNVGLAEEKSDNVLYLKSASALTDISIAISEVIKKITVDKFVLIDSISTMLIHNEPQVFARFIHGVLTNMRTNDTGGALISLELDTNREIRAEIAQLCDKVIKA